MRPMLEESAAMLLRLDNTMDPHGYSNHAPANDPSVLAGDGEQLAIPTCTTHLSGADLEQHCIARFDRLRDDRFGDFGRYGLSVSVLEHLGDGKAICHVRKSYPDFEGIFGHHSRQAIFDAKVCSQASFDLSKYRIESGSDKANQLRVMYRRSSFGAICFFLIHFNARNQLKTPTPAVTYAMPVDRDHPFWVNFAQGHEKRLSKAHLETYAHRVGWNCLGKERIPRPDIEAAIMMVGKARLGSGGRAGQFHGRW